jgi:hypothetical protein
MMAGFNERDHPAINCKSEGKDHRDTRRAAHSAVCIPLDQPPKKSPEHAAEVAAMRVVASSLSGLPVGHSNVFAGLDARLKEPATAMD